MSEPVNDEIEMKNQLLTLKTPDGKYVISSLGVNDTSNMQTLIAFITSLIASEKEKATEWAVKIVISKFLQMNLDNPQAPVNIDEVKRQALSELKSNQLSSGVDV